MSVSTARYVDLLSLPGVPVTFGAALIGRAAYALVFLPLFYAVAGLFFSPVMIVSYLAAHASGGEHRRNAATAWVNTSHNLGASLGSVLAGVLL